MSATQKSEGEPTVVPFVRGQLVRAGTQQGQAYITFAVEEGDLAHWIHEIDGLPLYRQGKIAFLKDQ